MKRQAWLWVFLCLGGWLAGPARAAGPEPSPTVPAPRFPPPYYHTVRSASSADGLTFTDDRPEDLAEHASVPSAVQFSDGTIRVYFVDFSSGREEALGCLESRDGGRTFTRVQARLVGLYRPEAVDFCPVLLPDGRCRLYFYAMDRRPQKAHTIDCASSSDGLVFERERTVFVDEGLVDPDVFWNGQEWLMYVFSLHTGRTVIARSADGLSFSYAGILPLRGYGTTQPLRLPDGTFRLYAFRQPEADHFVSFRSRDGMAWVREEGERFRTQEGYVITDPFVIQRQDGSYQMFYKRQKGRPRPPGPPREIPGPLGPPPEEMPAPPEGSPPPEGPGLSP